MVSLSSHFHSTNYYLNRNNNSHHNHNFRIKHYVSCSAQPTQTNIKVVINGAAKEIGRAAVEAVTKARGMELAGAVDTCHVGEDIGQSKGAGVVVDFTEPSSVYDNVKQVTAFGMRSVVHVPRMELDTVAALSAFCDKATMGVLVAPTLSIGSILLQQAAISASFHYRNVEIVESKANANDLPSVDANQIAKNLSNLGQIYNREDASTDVLARGQVLGDGIRVHSLVLPGLPSSTTVHFSAPGEIYSIKHDITNVQCLMPGLLLAIRKVVRLKNLVYGLEKFL
ncbi:dihydrodipicolinate reductase-like protein CRR1, chloroplastic isoform X2 [Arachis ipaensis]|uniref:dihydrodipicolinate reductase-like protein CRR1, chloroplastic isoform X2 n=1 Tax=Arachis ipaensis TaxID=130454 RepID=UPI000A2B9163|nr:dihydrodipicolinate reductase-like protein CRR1, chloroplastic isoform X2 [Arachis ipaensis]